MMPIPAYMWDRRRFVFLCDTPPPRRIGDVDQDVRDRLADLPPHHFLWVGRPRAPLIVKQP